MASFLKETCRQELEKGKSKEDVKQLAVLNSGNSNLIAYCTATVALWSLTVGCWQCFCSQSCFALRKAMMMEEAAAATRARTALTPAEAAPGELLADEGGEMPEEEQPMEEDAVAD